MPITTASEFRQRKPVTLPSGRTVEIRKIHPLDLQVSATRLFELAGMSREQIAERLLQDPALLEAGLRATEAWFTLGVVSPKISAKPIDELSDDEVHISDIGEDAESLLNAIMEFSGVQVA